MSLLFSKYTLFFFIILDLASGSMFNFYLIPDFMKICLEYHLHTMLDFGLRLILQVYYKVFLIYYFMDRFKENLRSWLLILLWGKGFFWIVSSSLDFFLHHSDSETPIPKTLSEETSELTLPYWQVSNYLNVSALCSTELPAKVFKWRL